VSAALRESEHHQHRLAGTVRLIRDFAASGPLGSAAPTVLANIATIERNLVRQQLHALVVAIVVSTAVGFGIASVSRPLDAQADNVARTAAADTRIVTELRKLNNRIGDSE
jgi:hypothetical protein